MLALVRAASTWVCDGDLGISRINQVASREDERDGVSVVS